MSKSHKWEPRWDDKEDSCVDVCIHCKIKRRNRVLFYKGTMKKGGTVTEYFINGVWSTDAHPICNAQISKPLKP